MASKYNLKITSSSVSHLGCYIPASLVSFLTPCVLTGSTLKMMIKAVLRTSFFMYNICQKRCHFGLSIKHLFSRGKNSLCKFAKCKRFCYDLIILCWLLLTHTNQFGKLWNFIPLLRLWVNLSILFSDKLCIICKYFSYFWRILLKVWHYQRTIEYSVLLSYPRKDVITKPCILTQVQSTRKQVLVLNRY